MALHLAHMSSATAVLVVDKQTIIKIKTAFLNFFLSYYCPPVCLTCWYAFPCHLSVALDGDLGNQFNVSVAYERWVTAGARRRWVNRRFSQLSQWQSTEQELPTDFSGRSCSFENLAPRYLQYLEDD